MPFKFEDEVTEGDFENEEDRVGVEADNEGDDDRDEEEDLFDLLDETLLITFNHFRFKNYLLQSSTQWL